MASGFRATPLLVYFFYLYFTLKPTTAPRALQGTLQHVACGRQHYSKPTHLTRLTLQGENSKYRPASLLRTPDPSKVLTKELSDPPHDPSSRTVFVRDDAIRRPPFHPLPVTETLRGPLRPPSPTTAAAATPSPCHIDAEHRHGAPAVPRRQRWPRARARERRGGGAVRVRAAGLLAMMAMVALTHLPSASCNSAHAHLSEVSTAILSTHTSGLSGAD